MELFESDGIKPGPDFYIFSCCKDAAYVESLGLREIRDTGDSVFAAAPGIP